MSRRNRSDYRSSQRGNTRQATKALTTMHCGIHNNRRPSGPRRIEASDHASDEDVREWRTIRESAVDAASDT